MYEIAILFLFLIGGSIWLIHKRRIKLTPLEKSLSTILIIGGIFGILATIPTIIDFFDEYEIWKNDTLRMIFAISVIGLIFSFQIFCSILFIRSGFLVYRNLRKSNIEISVLEDSKLCLGGKILFNVKFNAILENGFFKIMIRSPFSEEKSVTVKYDENKKIGLLRGKYENDNIKLKIPIPESFDSGNCKVIITIMDVTGWIFSIRSIREVVSKTINVDINEITTH